MIRRRNDEQLLAEYRHRHQIRSLDRQREESRVHSAGADLMCRPSGGGHRHADVEARMRAPELLEERRKHVQADGHSSGQSERPRERARLISDGADGFSEILKHAVAELHERFGCRRHAHLTPDSKKQRLAELVFEQQHLTADCRLRHVQLSSTCAERSGLPALCPEYAYLWPRYDARPDCAGNPPGVVAQ